MENIKKQILEGDLPYELEMFDAAVEYLQSPEFAASTNSDDRVVWFKRNAAIEAFWTHARNLIKFLERTPSKSIDEMQFEASARDFAADFHSNLNAKHLSIKSMRR
jgi:hypothetical protein